MHSTKRLLDRLVTGLLYGVLLVPLVFQQALMHPLVIAKTVFFQTLIEIAVAAYVTLAVFHKEYRPRITPLLYAVCGLLGAIAVSGVFGVNPMRSIWSVPERMTGIVLMAHLTAYFVLLSGMRPTFSWRRYLQASLAVSFGVALFPVIQLIFPAIFFDRLGDRLSGTIGNPIFLAAYLFFHVFIAGRFAAEARSGGRPWWPYALVALFELAVIGLTETRGALVAFFVACAVFSAYAVAGSGKKAKTAVFGSWIAVAVFAGIFWATRSNPLWQSVPVASRIAREGFTADNRLYAWKAGLAAFAEKPFTGVGWDNFYTAFNAHYDPRLLRGGFGETFFDRPHNVFVQFLAETGVVGFAAYIALLACAFYGVRRNAWMVAMLATYGTQNFFAFDSVSSYCAFFLVLAWIDASHAGNAPPVRADDAKTDPREIAVFAALLFAAFFGIYFFCYRPYAASRLEWTAVNYFVHGEIPEGLEYMDAALAAPTPYRAYMAKDLYPNIALLYKQDVPLPDVRSLVAKAVAGMQAAAESEPLNYGFWIGLADMMQPIAGLDPAYVDTGLAALEKAAAVSPRRQATEYVRAKLLNLKGDKAGSLAAMGRAVALDPEVGDAHFFYGLLLLEAGDRARGTEELARASALGREPKSAAEASAVGGQLGDLGAYKESIAYFGKALLFKPDDAELMMKLGLVYYFDGNKDAARRLIGEVMKKEDLSRSPQYPSLRAILIDLGLLK